MKGKRTQQQKNRWGIRTANVFEALDFRGSFDNEEVVV